MMRTPPLTELQRRIGRKWSAYPDDVLPAWIADMDFEIAPSIAAAMAEALSLSDFGYGPAAAKSGVSEAFAAWASRRWDWAVDPADVMLMPDVVGGVDNVIEALTRPGDSILVHTPAYPPLLKSVTFAERKLVEQPIVAGEIDVDLLAETVRRENVRMILLCHPHNPWGRCFRRDQLEAMARLADSEDLILLSDEVHADLTYDEHRHVPMALVAPERTVTLNAPSKAFNVAGLRLAICVAPPVLRERMARISPNRWSAFSAPGVRAARAAWSMEGEDWLRDCLTHLSAMRHRLADLLAQHCPSIRYRVPDAGYLAWLDCRDLGLADPADFFLREARVALSPGPNFGSPGEGFVRLNFATSPEILDAIIERMGAALSISPDIPA